MAVVGVWYLQILLLFRTSDLPINAGRKENAGMLRRKYSIKMKLPFSIVSCMAHHMFMPGFPLWYSFTCSCDLPLTTTFLLKKKIFFFTFENLAWFSKTKFINLPCVLVATMKRDNFLNGELTSDSD